MAKNNTDGNGAAVTNGSALPPTIHLVLLGKGGVGKTVVAGSQTHCEDRQHGTGNLEADGAGEMRQGEHWLTMFAYCSRD